MKQSNVSKYAYLAGLVDGEGCIAICQDSRNTSYFFVMLSIANRDGGIMDWLIGTFGGSVYHKSNKGFNGERIPIYEWRVYREKATPILKRSLPFLRIKKRQAEVWLRMAERLHRAGRPVGKTSLDAHELEVRLALFHECRSLKSHFVPPMLARD
jgi:hypothetical protein